MTLWRMAAEESRRLPTAGPWCTRLAPTVRPAGSSGAASPRPCTRLGRETRLRLSARPVQPAFGSSSRTGTVVWKHRLSGNPTGTDDLRLPIARRRQGRAAIADGGVRRCQGRPSDCPSLQEPQVGRPEGEGRPDARDFQTADPLASGHRYAMRRVRMDWLFRPGKSAGPRSGIGQRDPWRRPSQRPAIDQATHWHRVNGALLANTIKSLHPRNASEPTVAL